MNIQPFKLERYFAQYEFETKHLLCTSDCESMTVQELLDLEPVSHEKFHQLSLGYTESQGSPELRELAAGLYDNITAEDVLIHAGQEGIFLFMFASFEKGDHIIVHHPTYQSLFSLAQDRGVEVTLWETDESSGWDLNLDFLEQSIRPNTKAVVVNMPNNPTGYVMDRAKFDRLIEIVRKHNLLLFSDEAYRFLEFDRETQLPSAADLYENAVSLFVMSKGFGLPGLRIAWLTTRNKDLLQKMATLKDFTTICSSAPSEFLACVALRNKEKILNKNLGIIEDNLKLLDAFFEKHEDIFEWVRPRAASLAFVKLKGERKASEFCRELLEKKGVLLLPSTEYDMPDSYFRIGFGRKNMPECLELLEEFVCEK